MKSKITLSLLLCWWPPSGSHAPGRRGLKTDPVELVLGQRQLFVDELHVAAKRNIVTQFHQAVKKGAVIRPWGYGNMTGSPQTRSMPQWDPAKHLYVMPVMGGDPEAKCGHTPPLL